METSCFMGSLSAVRSPRRQLPRRGGLVANGCRSAVNLGFDDDRYQSTLDHDDRYQTSQDGAKRKFVEACAEAAGDNPRRILTAAARLFRQLRLDGPGGDAIAEVGGLKRAARYGQFESGRPVAAEARGQLDERRSTAAAAGHRELEVMGREKVSRLTSARAL